MVHNTMTSWQQLEEEIVDILRLDGVAVDDRSGEAFVTIAGYSHSISSLSRELFSRLNAKAVKVKA